MYWTLPNIVQRVRVLISMPSPVQVADQELINRVNDYYQSRFPVEVKPTEFNSFWRFDCIGAQVLATGDGSTATFTGTLNPVPGVCGVGFNDSLEVFESDENGVLWGTYGGTGTLNYQTGAYSVTFSQAPALGDDVNVYYDTYTIPDTVMEIMDPLNAAGYPVTFFQDPLFFWSKWPKNTAYVVGGAAPPIYLPNLPQNALLDDGRLTLRPAPDQGYTFEAKALLKPVALDLNVNTTVAKDIWGPLIAYETASEWLLEQGDTERLQTIEPGRKRALATVQTPKLSQLAQQKPKGRW